MKITRSRTHHLSLGNYEWFETSATVESEIDLDLIDIDEDTARKFEAALDILLATDLEEAADITGEKKSYIHLYQKDI